MLTMKIPRRNFFFWLGAVITTPRAFAKDYQNDHGRKHSKLIRAIRKVETPNGEQVGDGGLARGPLQIHRVYWEDALEHNPAIGGSYRDCSGFAYSSAIVLSYWQRYATAKRIGREVTDQDRARIHNGGPRGYKKAATNGYWIKVKSHLT